MMTREGELTPDPEGAEVEAERDEDPTAEAETIIHPAGGEDRGVTAETDTAAAEEDPDHLMIETNIHPEEDPPDHAPDLERDDTEKLRRDMTET